MKTRTIAVPIPEPQQFIEALDLIALALVRASKSAVDPCEQPSVYAVMQSPGEACS